MIEKVRIFGEFMQKELDANSEKGNWEDFKNAEEILNELHYHEDKLDVAIEENNKLRIREHIADCANLLLMLGNSYGLYDNGMSEDSIRNSTRG